MSRKCCNLLNKYFLTLLIFNKVLFIYYIQKFTEYIEGVGFVSIAGPVVLMGQEYAHLPSRIFRPAPRFCPAWVAPLFCPAWRPMMVCPAFSCSSVNSRLHSSEGLGPRYGPGHSGCRYVCRQTTIILHVLFESQGAVYSVLGTALLDSERQRLPASDVV